MKVPTTFNEMLLFNASVMGYGSSTWMNIVLQQFDDMATRLWSQLDWANMCNMCHGKEVFMLYFPCFDPWVALKRTALRARSNYCK